LLAGDIPSPLKNESVFQLVSHEFFAKKLPLDDGFTLGNWNKNRYMSASALSVLGHKL
jgi:hypothetical protein